MPITTIEVTYPFTGDLFTGDTSKDEILNDIASNFRAERLGSGCGFGFRDIEWEVHREDAEKMLAALKAVDFVHEAELIVDNDVYDD